MSECTEHLGDPLASKKGPGLNQQDSPRGDRSTCNSTGGIEQEGGGVGGRGRQVARNPRAHPPPPNPRISLPEQTLGDLERVPWVARILLWAVSFWEEECWFLLGWGGVLLPSDLQIRIKGTHRHGGGTRDPETAASGQPSSLKIFSSFFWHIYQAPFGCKCQTT